MEYSPRRLKDTQEHLSKDYDLLKKLEDALRVEGDPQRRAQLDLQIKELKDQIQIRESELRNLPLHTFDERKLLSLRPSFEPIEQPVGMVHPPEEHDVAEDRLYEKSKIIRGAIDVGIVIALKEEFREFYIQLRDNCDAIQDMETGCFFYIFERVGNNRQRPYVCVATLAGQMGHTRSALVTQTLINLWHPQSIVNIGIAAGVSKDISLGDVVVASQVDSYLERSKAVSGKSLSKTRNSSFSFELSGEVYRASGDLVKMVQNYEFDQKSAYQKWQQSCKDKLDIVLPVEKQHELQSSAFMESNANVHEGHLASGPTVAASLAFTQWLKEKRDRSYLALEMEAGGVLEAVYEQANSIRSLVIRGVSDLGDERKANLDSIKKGAMRRYAMHNATQLLWSILESGRFPQSEVSKPFKHFEPMRRIYPSPSPVTIPKRITFHDHIRIDRTALRDAVTETSNVYPEIEWHPKIKKALQLIETMRKEIDEKIRRFPWYKNYPETRTSNLLGFKIEFYEAYDGLLPRITEIREQFIRLLGLTSETTVTHRLTAFVTFLSMSALRLVFYIQQFEGKIIDDDGNVIIRFFEDLPKVPGILLRLVPCMSNVGLLAFGERSYLRCRVGHSDTSYEYIILPQRLAERLHTEGIRNDVLAYYRWVLPQWIARTNEIPPQADNWVVSVVSDETGREKYMPSDLAPWQHIELKDCEQRDTSEVYGGRTKISLENENDG